ncbi:MAG: hypothetical protein D6815_05400, partial [Candidatus Dadabacteria bacterium]
MGAAARGREGRVDRLRVARLAVVVAEHAHTVAHPVIGHGVARAVRARLDQRPPKENERSQVRLERAFAGVDVDRSSNVLSESVHDACRSVARRQRQGRPEVAVAHRATAIVRIGLERLVAYYPVSAFADRPEQRGVAPAHRAVCVRRAILPARAAAIPCARIESENLTLAARLPGNRARLAGAQQEGRRSDGVVDVGIVADARKARVQVGHGPAAAEVR